MIKTSDRLVGDIPEECLVPFPLTIEEGDIDKNIPLAPIRILDKDNYISCGNCYKEFKRAEKCPHCGQFMFYPKRFFGNIIDS